MLLIPCLTALHPSSHPRAGRVHTHTHVHMHARTCTHTHPSDELRGTGQTEDLDGPWFASRKSASSGGGREGKRLTYKIKSRPTLCVGSDDMPTVRLEAECVQGQTRPCKLGHSVHQPRQQAQIPRSPAFLGQ